MFFKIPNINCLSDTSYRCRKIVNDCIYIEYNEGYIGNDWEIVDEAFIHDIAPEWFNQNNVEISQLDRIELLISKSIEELRQEGAEALTLELIEGGIL